MSSVSMSVSIKRVVVLGAVAVLGFTACSKSSSGGGDGGQPVGILSDAQMKRFDGTANAIGESTSWKTQGAGATRESQPATRVAKGAASMPPSAAVRANLQQDILNNCQLKADMPSDSGTATNGQMPESFKMSVAAAGPQCPISFSLDSSFDMPMGSDAAVTSLSANFAVAYKALSKEARSLEVQEYILKLGLNASNNALTGSGDGYVITQTDGKVTISFSASGAKTGDTVNDSMALTLTYQDGLKVEMRQVDVNGKSSYFINNKAVDAKTFNAYMAKIAPSFGGSSAAGSEPDTDPSTTPSQPTTPGQTPSIPSYPMPAQPGQTPAQPAPPQPYNPGGGSSTVTLSYQFRVNGCDTGLQTFTSATEADALAQLCTGLQDNKRNRYCALSDRADKFSDNCPGQRFLPH